VSGGAGEGSAEVLTDLDRLACLIDAPANTAVATELEALLDKYPPDHGNPWFDLREIIGRFELDRDYVVVAGDLDDTPDAATLAPL
jgi:hypothetical protein